MTKGFRYNQEKYELLKKLLILIFTLLLISEGFAQRPLGHQAFDTLLKRYVDDDGMVDYRGLRADSLELEAYLTFLSKNPPQEHWSEQEALAFWINAYNAFTLKLITDYYPVKSIKDIGSTIQIPFVNTPWDITFIKIGEGFYDLNEIEHGILRKRFSEPRIHFALVCAAMSCPKLQREAYTAAELDHQLDEAARFFLADKRKNEFLNEQSAEVSMIFNWFGGDFTKKEILAEYLSRYAPLRLSSTATISYKEYDWSLNEQ